MEEAPLWRWSEGGRAQFRAGSCFWVVLGLKLLDSYSGWGLSGTIQSVQRDHMMSIELL